MQLQEPVYQSLGPTDASDITPDGLSRARRRPFKNNLVNRLNQIMSIYIPSTSSNDHRSENEADLSDHTGLLSPREPRVEFCTKKSDGQYSIKLIHRGERLIQLLVQQVNVSKDGPNGQLRQFVALAADTNTIYVGLEDLPYVFLISPRALESQEVDELSTKEPDSGLIKGFIHLHTPRMGDIVPREFCVHTLHDDNTVLYVVGRLLTTYPAAKESHKWILAKFSLSGEVLAQTRAYDYQRYSGLSIDTLDGNLLLACPTLQNPSGYNHSDLHTMAGQLCKLTPGFERRMFSVTMGKDSVIYNPDFITQESAGRHVWASMKRCTFQDLHENGENLIGAKSSRRLFSFPGRQYQGTVKQSPREWLQPVSWEFANLKPGRVVAFDAEHVLILDDESGSLSYISWPSEATHPVLNRITRPSPVKIKLLCSTYDARQPESTSNWAYFIADSNIYSFQFVETQANCVA